MVCVETRNLARVPHVRSARRGDTGPGDNAMSVALSPGPVERGEKELSEVGHQHLRPALIVIHLLFTLRQQVDIHRREAALLEPVDAAGG